MSEKCHFRKSVSSFDHFVGSGKQCLRYRKAEAFGGLEVYPKQVGRGLLKWQVARFLAAQNTVDVTSGLAKHFQYIRTVGDQPSGFRKQRARVDSRHAVACRRVY